MWKKYQNKGFFLGYVCEWVCVCMTNEMNIKFLGERMKKSIYLSVIFTIIFRWKYWKCVCLISSLYVFSFYKVWSKLIFAKYATNKWLKIKPNLLFLTNIILKNQCLNFKIILMIFFFFFSLEFSHWIHYSPLSFHFLLS